MAVVKIKNKQQSRLKEIEYEQALAKALELSKKIGLKCLDMRELLEARKKQA